jgi:hypothetical protein
MAQKKLGAAHRKAYLRKWYRENRERILQKQKAERPIRLELQQEWVAENVEHVRERQRIYSMNPVNKERKNALARARRAALRSIRPV